MESLAFALVIDSLFRIGCSRMDLSPDDENARYEFLHSAAGQSVFGDAPAESLEAWVFAQGERFAAKGVAS